METKRPQGNIAKLLAAAIETRNAADAHSIGASPAAGTMVAAGTMDATLLIALVLEDMRRRMIRNERKAEARREHDLAALAGTLGGAPYPLDDLMAAAQDAVASLPQGHIARIRLEAAMAHPSLNPEGKPA